jgi:hypothetical protein
MRFFGHFGKPYLQKMAKVELSLRSQHPNCYDSVFQERYRSKISEPLAKLRRHLEILRAADPGDGAHGVGAATDSPKPADGMSDVYHGAKWYDEHGPADGRAIRKAIADGHKIRKRKLPNGKNEYAEADVVSRWGAVKKKSE